MHDHRLWGKDFVAGTILVRLIFINHLNNSNMRKCFFTLALLAISAGIFAQSFTARVLVLNEGYYDYFADSILVPVSIGAYNPATNVYTTLDEIEGARFASDIVIDGDAYFVAADHSLLKYDLNTDMLLDAADVSGIRKIAVTNEYIVVTRGEYLVELPSYIQVYNRSTLDLIFEIPADELPYTTEGVTIVDNMAYIAVNNGFVFGSEVGQIVVLDLDAQMIDQTIDLGADGINPDNLMIEGEYIYTLNNKDFTGSSVSAYRMTTGELSTTNLMNISSGCGTSAINSGTIYYQELFGTTISRFDAASQTIVGEDEVSLSFYGLDFDPVSGNMYTSETDYFSYGKVHVYNADLEEIAMFDAGVSPGTFAFDVRLESAISDMPAIAFTTFPNPVADVLHVQSAEAIRWVSVQDITGKQLLIQDAGNQQLVEISVRDFASGMYTITVGNTQGMHTQTFIK